MPRYAKSVSDPVRNTCPLGRIGGDWYLMVAASPERGAMTVRPGRTVLCRCGHERLAHEHYRRGSECALCECPRWSPPGLLHRFGPGFLRDLFRRQQP